MIKYRIFRSLISDSELGSYISYGIRAYLVTGKRKTLIAQLSDMSLDRSKMIRLADYLNLRTVSPFLMLRAAEDILDL